ncbi:MAG: hypothetical protein IJR83_05880, partial [Clostridia bacterium]|nr:hypothetical protein [Clostridia bacterium]
GQLGIDGKDLDKNNRQYVLINSAAYYNFSGFNQKLAARYIKLTITLAKKSDNYEEALRIPDYLFDFEVLDKNGDSVEETSGTDTSYSFIILLSDLEETDPGSYSYYIPINFKVYSGNNSDFEHKVGDSNMEYSNYRVIVTAGLLGENVEAGIMTGSDGSDHIVYTNAKIHSEVID